MLMTNVTLRKGGGGELSKPNQGGDGGSDYFVPVVVWGLGRLLWLARLLGRGLEPVLPRQTSLSLCQT